MRAYIRVAFSVELVSLVSIAMGHSWFLEPIHWVGGIGRGSQHFTRKTKPH